jgi:hypothetical protein
VTSARLPYVKRKRGLLFWQPNPAMRAKGFLPKPLGPESPQSLAEARRLYEAWLKTNAEDRRLSAWPAGSLGAYVDRMRQTTAWAKKMPRTREDYDRAWRHLGPALGHKTLTRISVEDVEQLADAIEAAFGPHERYRAIKCLRAIFADAIQRLRLVGYPSPAKGIRNPQPRGRNAIWLGAEVAKLIATAEAEGYPGMAIAIRIAWETLFSPIDVWSLTRAQLKRDAGGAYLELAGGRQKTGKAAYGAISAATEAAIAAFHASLAFEIPPDGALIRQRNGHAYRSKDTFGDDFRAVRAIAFPGDRRQFQDLRRSGNVEADAAGADKSTMAEILANTLDTSAFLDATYTPPTVAKARQVAELRLKGRKRLAGEITRTRRI